MMVRITQNNKDLYDIQCGTDHIMLMCTNQGS